MSRVYVPAEHKSCIREKEKSSYYPHEGYRVCIQRNVLSIWALLTVLVDEHSYGDTAGVETVQEVLDVVVSNGVLVAEGVLVLDHALSHGGNHLVVAVPDGF